MGVPVSCLLPFGVSPRSDEHRQHLADELHKAEARRQVRNAHMVRFMAFEEPSREPVCVRISRREARRLIQAFGSRLLVESFGARWCRICTICLQPF